ncbi:MAG: magnesium and cobalt transport protein CorA [Propionibacteriaceae bacterium]|jgi:magnesium transporter|nr:magnesium and cobalt transport protein CorA [Propionibacteriaceae bacterium]
MAAARTKAAEQPVVPIFTAALYRDGQRILSTEDIAETQQALQRNPGAMAWIGMYEPSEAVLTQTAELFNIHELAIEDAIKAHQRPKLDRYDDIVLTVLYPARYQEGPGQRVELGEIHVITGSNYAITVRHCDIPMLDGVRERMESEPKLLKAGPIAVLYAVLDAVVDLYQPIIEELEDDIEELETEVFGGNFELSKQIYQLSRQIAGLGRALRSTEQIVGNLIEDFGRDHVHSQLRDYLADVADHLTHARERAESMHGSLREILSVQSALVAQQQNEEMRKLSLSEAAENSQTKRISAWAGILFTPTIITGIYGMNFANMPELHWPLGYLFSLMLMVGIGLLFYLVFKKKNWI